MVSSIAFVGAGPTTLYTLKQLLDRAARPFDVTVFEAQPEPGMGTPYRPGWNDPAMLANIASIEIPPVEETLVEWMKRQPSLRLAALGVDPENIDDRTFYPRVALGQFFSDQFQALIARAKRADIGVSIRSSCRVMDAISNEDAIELHVRPQRGVPSTEQFDHVVLATGHQWPDAPEVAPGYFLSPYPSDALSRLPACRTGIRGSSLSAIDAVVALASNHGEFAVERDGALTYVASTGSDDFHMTMMSRKGLLPEADFYFPLPYEPLSICTAEAISNLIDTEDDLLEAAYALFKKELIAIDPGYSASIGLADLPLDDFSKAYFAARSQCDPFEWAERNLREAEENYARAHTVPWRYAILRMHEVLELIVPHLDDDEFERFMRCLSPVFTDDYATVPHESIRRLLALHRAGRLEVLAVGEDYTIDHSGTYGGAVLKKDGLRTHFPVFVEAMGQRALTAKDFPFPSLYRQGIVRDVSSDGRAKPSRGIAVDGEYHPVSDEIPEDQLFCLSLPFLMGRHPFVQGLTSAHGMGGVVAEKLASIVNDRPRPAFGGYARSGGEVRA